MNMGCFCKKLANRRDRRKAKASKWRREGTVDAKRHVHHIYGASGVFVGLVTKRRKKTAVPGTTGQTYRQVWPTLKKK
jgi:hypothetical protein